MLSNCVNFISAFFDLSVYLLFMSHLMHFQKTTRKKAPVFLLFLALQVLCCFVPIISQNDPVVFVLQTISILLPVYLYFKPDARQFLLHSAVTYCLIFMIQFLFAVLISVFAPTLNRLLLTILGCVYTLLITLVLVHWINFKNLYRLLFLTHKIGFMILSNILLCALAISFYFKIQLHSFMDTVVYFCLAITLFAVVNLILFNQSFTISRKDEQLKAYNEYMPVLNELILSVRARQHNHVNEIQAIIGLMYTHKDYESLTSAMSDTLDAALDNKEPDYLLKLNLLLVSGFLYQKQRYAQSIGRDIVFDFHTYELHSAVPEYQLVKLFGIMIDNALEAVPEEEHIFVSVDSRDHRIEFTTRNAGFILSQKDYENFFKNGYSKKPGYAPKQKHAGLGLYYLRSLVLEQYHGEITLWNEGNDILLKIFV